MTFAEANLVCLALVAADLAARAVRIQWFLRGLGYRLRFLDALAINAVGDAACGLTPLRIGGEPSRLAMMLRSRIPATAAFVAIGYEVLAAWPVIILSAAVLILGWAPEWWASVKPNLVHAGRELGPWMLVIAVLTVLAWFWVRRRAPAATHQLRRPLRRTLVHWRRMAKWPLFASGPLTLVNVVARVAMLPVLALTLPHPPPLGPTVVGSFALLYSQLILPTPSGAGAVDLGFLAGAAGDLGGDQARLLLLWRLYTSGIGVALGLIIGIRIYGWAALRGLLGRPGGVNVVRPGERDPTEQREWGAGKRE